MEVIEEAMNRMYATVLSEVDQIHMLNDSRSSECADNILTAIACFMGEIRRMKPGATKTLNTKNAYFMHEGKITVFLTTHEARAGKSNGHGCLYVSWNKDHCFNLFKQNCLNNISKNSTIALGLLIILTQVKALSIKHIKIVFESDLLNEMWNSLNEEMVEKQKNNKALYEKVHQIKKEGNIVVECIKPDSNKLKCILKDNRNELQIKYRL